MCADVALLLDRVSCSALKFTEDQESLVLCIGSGFAPGDAWVAELFNEVMAPCLSSWNENAPELAIEGQLEWIDSDGDLARGEFDCSRACYADDLSRVVMGWGFGNLCLNVAVSNSALNLALWPLGFRQNQDKQVALPYICGRGTHSRLTTLYSVGTMASAKVLSAAKWLGYMAHFAGNHNAELEKRLSAARRNFAKLKGFWHMGPRKFVSTVFQSAVCSTARSGLEALIAGKTMEKRIDNMLCSLARPLFKGHACKKIVTLAGTKYEALSNEHVWHRIRVAPTCVELRISRLRLWQRMLRYRESLCSLWTVLVGSFDWDHFEQFEVDGKLVIAACHACQRNRSEDITSPCKHSANPWLRQFFFDLLALTNHEGFEHLAEQASLNFKDFLLNPKTHEEFLMAKFDALRSPYLTRNVPPPGCFRVTETPLDPEKPFVCRLRLDSGQMCNEAFTTRLGLTMHQIKSKTLGANHGHRALARAAVLDNKCPVCELVFSSRFGAQGHLVRSIAQGKCNGRGNPTAKHIGTKQTCCPLCDMQCDSVPRLKTHIRLFHLQEVATSSNCEINLDSSSENDQC